MKRILITSVIILSLAGAVLYAAGVFTVQVMQEEACPLCRAIRHSQRQYGFTFTSVEDLPFTTWYRENIDADHGLDAGHPHMWFKSGCKLTAAPQAKTVDEDCTWIPAVLLIRPEVELAVLRQIPDADTRLALIRSLHSDSREKNTRRVRILVEYYFVQRDKMAWTDWWNKNAFEFGLKPAPV